MHEIDTDESIFDENFTTEVELSSLLRTTQTLSLHEIASHAVSYRIL